MNTKIMLPCIHEWINTGEVTFLDCSEDFEGRDVLKYRCPECGEIHESVVYSSR